MLREDRSMPVLRTRTQAEASVRMLKHHPSRPGTRSVDQPNKKGATVSGSVIATTTARIVAAAGCKDKHFQRGFLCGVLDLAATALQPHETIELAATHCVRGTWSSV